MTMQSSLGSESLNQEKDELELKKRFSASGTGLQLATGEKRDAENFLFDDSSGKRKNFGALFWSTFFLSNAPS